MQRQNRAVPMEVARLHPTLAFIRRRDDRPDVMPKLIDDCLRNHSILIWGSRVLSRMVVRRREASPSGKERRAGLEKADPLPTLRPDAPFSEDGQRALRRERGQS